MYRIISQYSKYFSVNSLNHPLKINVRLKRMFNMLLFEYFEIMVGNIYQMYLYEISLVMISAVIFKYANYLIVRIYFG